MSRTQELKRNLSLALQGSAWAEALSTLKKLIDQEEGQPAYYNQMGDIYLRMGKQDDAVESFMQGIKAYSQLGMFPNGAALCKKVLRLEPEHREAIWMLGELKTRQGFLSDGAEKMLDALRLYSDDPQTKKDVLVGLLEQAEQLQGGSREVLEIVAITYAQVDEREQARAVTLRIADIEDREGKPEVAGYLRRLAQEYVQEMKPEAADESGLPSGETGKATDAATSESELQMEAAPPVMQDASPAESMPPVAQEAQPAEAAPPIMQDASPAESMPPVAGETQPADAAPPASQEAPPLETASPAGEEPLSVAVESREQSSGTSEESLLDTQPIGAGLQAEEPADLEDLEMTKLAPTCRVLGETQLPRDDKSVDRQQETSPGQLFSSHPCLDRTLPDMDVLTPDTTQESQAETGGQQLADSTPGLSTVDVLSPDAPPGDSVEPQETSEEPVLELQNTYEAILPDDELDKSKPERRGTETCEDGEENGEPEALEIIEATPPDLNGEGSLRSQDDPVTIGLSTSTGWALQGDDVEQVLHEFRTRLEDQLGSMAPEERYQLGVSYMEMDLYEEALAEFEHTSEHKTLGQKTREWMAHCLLKLKRYTELIELLESALEGEPFPRKSSVELYYVLGEAYEALGKKDLALDSFTKVYQLDMEFHDVQAKLEKLTRPE